MASDWTPALTRVWVGEEVLAACVHVGHLGSLALGRRGERERERERGGGTIESEHGASPGLADRLWVHVVHQLQLWVLASNFTMSCTVI